MYAYARQYDKALETFNDILKLDPDFSPTLNFRSNMYALKGMEEESDKDLERSIRGASDYDRNSMLAYQAAWFGHKEEALKHFEAAERIVPYQKSLPFLKAAFSGLMGDADEFFKWAGPAMESKELTPESVRYAWWLDKVRTDPRYAELIKSLPG